MYLMYISDGWLSVGVRQEPDELRLIGRLVVDGAEPVAWQRNDKLPLSHYARNFRSPPIHLESIAERHSLWDRALGLLGTGEMAPDLRAWLYRPRLWGGRITNLIMKNLPLSSLRGLRQVPSDPAYP